MAVKEYKQAKDLPIRTAVWRLLACERDHKYNLGQDLVLSVRNKLRMVARANRAHEPQERLQVLLELQDEYQDVADIVKYMTERGYLGDDKHGEKMYVASIPLLANVGRQAAGLIRQTQNEIAGISGS